MKKSPLTQPHPLNGHTELLCCMPPLISQMLLPIIGIICMLARSTPSPLALATLFQPEIIDIQGKFFRWVYGKESNILDRAEIQFPANGGVANVIQRNMYVINAR